MMLRLGVIGLENNFLRIGVFCGVYCYIGL
jgi:hypothetical protein